MPLAWLVLIAAGVLDVEHRVARIAGLGAAGTLRIGVLPFAKA